MSIWLEYFVKTKQFYFPWCLLKYWPVLLLSQYSLCLNTRRKHRKIPSVTEHTFHGLMSLFLHVLSAIFNPWFKGKFLLLAFMRHFIILIAENSTFYIWVFMCQSLSEYNNFSLITTWISTVTFFRSCVQRSSIIRISKMFCHIHLNVLDH